MLLVVALHLAGVLEEVPDDPGEVSLILGAKVINIGLKELSDIVARQQVDPRPEQIVDLDGQGVGEVVQIAFRQPVVGGEAIPTHKKPR